MFTQQSERFSYFMKRFQPAAVVAAAVLAFVLVLPGSLLAAGNPNAKPGPLSPAVHKVISELNVPITLRDGIKVVADIHRPDAPGKFPVLVNGTPYGKQNSTEFALLSHQEIVPRGYVLVIYDLRGRNNSEGGPFLFRHMGVADDGYDVVEWAAAQPWSNGKVAAVGNSYDGQVVLATASSQPPHLVAAASMLTAADLALEWYWRGGAYELSFLTRWLTTILGGAAGEPIPARYLQGKALEENLETIALFNADPVSYSMVVPLTDFEPSRITDKVNFIKEWMLHPLPDEYWAKLSPRSIYGRISVPVLHIAGWYDIFLAGSLKNYLDLQKDAGTALARENQRLIAGPWFHQGAGFQSSKLGEFEYGPNLITPTFNENRVAFLDYWLKDTISPLFDVDNPVRIFTAGDLKWRNVKSWPLPETRYTNFYLNGGKSGTIDSLNDGTLSTSKAAAGTPAATYVYDPEHPTPNRGGSTLFSFQYTDDGSSTQGVLDQRPVDRRSLTFTSKPLDKPMEITGPISAVIYASSSAVDTDWVVRLSEVKPDGRAENIQDGILRARYRDSRSEPKLMEPGKIYEFKVDLWANSYVVPAGSALRVTINSSSFPQWSRNMNVAEYPEQATKWVVANNTIYLDPEHPSHVILPVIPR
jgi:putative CocE/NonD family hydrolase